jgi:hypothetical protein
MASEQVAWQRVEEHHAVRDDILPWLAERVGTAPPVIVPGYRHSEGVAQANQGAINSVLIVAVQELMVRVADLEQQLAAKSR